MSRLKSVLAALTISLSAAAAMADTVSYTTSISSATSLAPQLQQFDPSKGTLTGVSVSLNLAITPIATVYNIGSSPVPFTEAWVGTNPANEPGPPRTGPDTPFTVTDPYNNANLISTDYSFNAGSGIANPGVNNFADPNPISMADLLSSVPSASFSNYIGSGNYTLTYVNTTTATAQGSPGFPLFYGQNFSLDGSAIVTYTYDIPVGAGPVPAPLPASALSGFVLFGALFAARKLRTA